MKIQVFDIPHIINQIKRASPPKDKDTHKLLNNLAILLEKNTKKKSSPLDASLVSVLDRLNEVFLDLCFKRKELTKKFSSEYLKMVDEAYAVLRRNKEALATPVGAPLEKIVWDLKTMGESSVVMPSIFSKIQKARSVIEDAIEGNKEMTKDPVGSIETFFSD